MQKIKHHAALSRIFWQERVMPMERSILYCAGCKTSARYASVFLSDQGAVISPEPTDDVTHLLLDVPSFNAEGMLQDGSPLTPLLQALPTNVIICGGNLEHPDLAGYQKVDLLQDSMYLAENAYITAECALEIGLLKSSLTLRHCPVLVIGWGRIGKCLADLLKRLGAEVTVAARKETDRAMITALGYRAIDTGCMAAYLGSYRLIYNTAPEMVLPKHLTNNLRPDCVKIDLASKPGIDAEGVIWARGLPGIHRPESSGKLIAQTFLRLISREGSP